VAGQNCIPETKGLFFKLFYLKLYRESQYPTKINNIYPQLYQQRHYFIDKDYFNKEQI